MTNVAIQKNAPDYDPDKGCKWSTQQLRKYLAAKHGVEAVRHSRGCTRHLSSHLIPSFEILNMDVLYVIKLVYIFIAGQKRIQRNRQHHHQITAECSENHHQRQTLL